MFVSYESPTSQGGPRHDSDNALRPGLDVVADPSPGFERWQPSERVAYWDGCRQTLEEADNRVEQYVASVLTYIPALAAAGLSVVAVSSASTYFLGFVAALVIGIAGLGIVLEAKSAADTAFNTLYGAIAVTTRVEALLGVPNDIRLATEIGKLGASRTDESHARSLRRRFDRFCIGLAVAFALLIALGAVGMLLHY